MLDALLLLLGRGLVLFEQVQVVSVTTENSLVVHNVQGVALVLLIAVKAISIRLAELILPLNNSGLGAVKCLGHFQK